MTHFHPATMLSIALVMAMAPAGRDDPTPSCAAQLDCWCANRSNAALAPCYAEAAKARVTTPLVAAFSTAVTGPASRWRCYSPSDLAGDPATTPIMQRQRVLDKPGFCKCVPLCGRRSHRPPCPLSSPLCGEPLSCQVAGLPGCQGCIPCILQTGQLALS